jgi:uncharacterized delta-60 repeat protein
MSQASAGTTPFDHTFGSGGIVLLPSQGRYHAQDAPAVLPDGRIVVAGLLRNSSDRAFLARLSRAGDVDTGFGGGWVHTNVIASDRQAATAVTSEEKIVVAGADVKAGRIGLQRFLPSGQPDSTFGSNGKVSVTIGGKYAFVRDLVTLPGERALVAVATDAGPDPAFTIAKLDPGGALDPTFGSKGIARVAFSRPSATNALAVASDGSIFAAGSVGTEGSASSDTGLVRLLPNGTPDPTFGSGGKVVTDATATGAGDHAVSLALGENAVTVTGPAALSGMVARYGPTGALDESFGVGGIVHGGLGDGSDEFAPVGVVHDQAGRIVVTGTSAPDSGAARWSVLRMRTSGASPLDAAFAGDGHISIDSCDLNAGFGPSGIAVGPGGRIVASASCGSDGQIAVVRLLGTNGLPSPVILTVTPVEEAAGSERIRLSEIDPTQVAGLAATLQGAPLRSSPLRSSPLRSSPLRSSPLRSSPLRSSPLRSSDLAPLLLSSIPLRNSSWREVLAGTNLDVPVQSATLQDVFALDPVPPGLNDLTLADVDLNATPLRDASLAAFLLAPRPLDALPAPSGGWCAFLAGGPVDCTSGVDPSRDSLLFLELRGVNLSPYYSQPLNLAAADLGSGDQQAALARILLVDVELSATPFGAVPASEVADLLACGPACTGTLAEQQAAAPEHFTSATLGDLIERLPLPSLADISLGRVLVGLIPAAEIPYERAPLGTLLAAADLRSGNLHSYQVGFEVECGQAEGLKVGVELPEGARVVPGSATSTRGTATGPAPDPELGGNPALSVSGVCTPAEADDAVVAVTVTFDVEPGYILGPDVARALVRTDSSLAPASSPAVSIVDDSRDADTDPDGQRVLTPDAILTGHIAGAEDTDIYRLPAPSPGSRVTVSLSHLPADYDLQVYGPQTGIETSPLRSSPLRSSPLRSSSVPDVSREPNSESTVVPPDSVQDLPLRSSPLRSSSINRGTADESATFLVRDSDEGEDFTVVVSGFNGTSDPRPYVLRTVVAPGSSPLPCDARDLQLGAPGVLPASVPATTETFILVNRRRLAANFGEASATEVMSRLSSFAARPDVRGVVIPVEGDPAVDAAYTAWDADPCSPDVANTVVARINDLVDRLRVGLNELRFFMIAGGDEIVPQGRIPDLTVLANESEYADDVASNGKDDAQSRALRDGNVLSDDVYGDFDPQERLGTDLFVPDVAIGRLVETPGEITGQLDRYEAFDGRLDPQTSFVTGYDFIDDGAEEIFQGLTPLPQPGALLNDDTHSNWDEQDALAGFNNATASAISVNAHYDHYRALPSAAFSGDGSPNLLHASQVSPAAGAVLFNIGCHAGFNASDASVSFAPGNKPEKLDDFAQRILRAGAVYTANTGYGYGDTDVVAYSERLFADFASNLASGDMTLGQALMFAKQHYATALGVGDDYDAKVLHQATTYGPPMYRIGPNGTVAPPALPEGAPDAAAANAGDPTLKSSTVTVTPAVTRHDGDRGSYWSVPGDDPLVVQHHPIQPRTRVDVTAADGLPVHGAIPESLTTMAVTGVDPVYARPTIDLSTNEPEATAEGVIFPAMTHAVAHEATPFGKKDVLDVIVGQFRDDPGGDGSGTQLLVTDTMLRVYRSDSDDWTPPTIDRVEGLVVMGGAVFSVETSNDAVGGAILYQTDLDDAWKRLDLTRVRDGLLGAAVVLPEGASQVRNARIYVRDAAGNVGQAQNKGFGHTAQPIQTPGEGDPRVLLDPEPPASGFYNEGTGAPRVSLDPGEHSDATFLFRVDDQAFEPYRNEPFPVDGEGAHVVEFRGSDGSRAVAVVAIDTEGPFVIGEATRPPDANGWYSAPVTVAFTCSDAVSGVEPGSCPADVELGQEGEDLSIEGTAVDRAGNVGRGSASGIDIDLSKPAVSITRPPNGILLAIAGARLTGSASDTLSGVDRVEVHYTPQSGNGQTLTVAASLECDTLKRSCSWSAAPPPLGEWRAVAFAWDRAGHMMESQAVLFSVSSGINTPL